MMVDLWGGRTFSGADGRGLGEPRTCQGPLAPVTEVGCHLGISKNSGKITKMDGFPFHGSKPYEQMDDLGGFYNPHPLFLVGWHPFDPETLQVTHLFVSPYHLFELEFRSRQVQVLLLKDFFIDVPGMVSSLCLLFGSNFFWENVTNLTKWLGGGFKDCLFSPLFGEDSHFD